MKVIFLKDVRPTARAGDIREVKNGYARNYLLPRRLAAMATPGELRRVQKLRAEAEERRLAEAADWREVATLLAETPVEVTVRSGPRGRLYGSVTNTMVAARLSEMTEREVDRRGIRFAAPIRQLGEYTVPVRLFDDVEAEIQLVVRPEDGGEAMFDEVDAGQPGDAADEPGDAGAAGASEDSAPGSPEDAPADDAGGEQDRG